MHGAHTHTPTHILHSYIIIIIGVVAVAAVGLIDIVFASAQLREMRVAEHTHTLTNTHTQ